MAELKKKLKNLNFIKSLSSTSLKSPEETAESLVNDPVVVKLKEENRGLPLNNPHKEQEVLESIPQICYSDDPNFDAAAVELEVLPPVLDVNEINAKRKIMRQQLSVVSKKISDLILENHPSYAAELQRVQELQLALRGAHDTTLEARRLIEEAESRSTVAGLRLLAKHRKKHILIALARALQTIKTIEETDTRLRELLEEENYPAAVQLCLECQKAAQTFKYFACIRELSRKLQDTLVLMENELDKALARISLNFHAPNYARLLAAFHLLGKTQGAVDQLVMHYSAGINNAALAVLVDFMESSGTPGSALSKYHFIELAKSISGDKLIKCLLELCSVLWSILHSYHCALHWHQINAPWIQSSLAENSAAAGTSMGPGGDAPGVSGIGNATPPGGGTDWVQRRLEQGLVRVWQETVQKIATLVGAADLTVFKFDAFLQLVRILNRVMEVGSRHFSSQSEALTEVLRDQSSIYFRMYHRGRMEEMRMFLENEAWELCPMRATFNLFSLQEFSFLRRQGSSNTQLNEVTTAGRNDAVGAGGDSATSDLLPPFEPMYNLDNPFVVGDFNTAKSQFGEEDGSLSDGESDGSEDLEGDYIDELTGSVISHRHLPHSHNPQINGQVKNPVGSLVKPVPLLSNTGLNLLRLFGRYLHMVNMLVPVAFEVVASLTQLFDYYLYSVWRFFGRELEPEKGGLSSKLSTALRRIEAHVVNLTPPSNTPNSLIYNSESTSLPSVPSQHGTSDRVGVASLSSAVPLSDPASFYAFKHRIVAVESLLFIVEQLNLLHDHLESVIPPAKKPFLQQFYTQTVSVACDLRQPVYAAVAARALDYAKFLQAIISVNWEVDELMSQHSHYVDIIIQDAERVSQRMSEVGQRVVIPKHCLQLLWECIARNIFRTMVEGYSSGRRCSNEGRALMQLDFQQLVLKLEALSGVRPMPEKEYVDNYIKAYYMPEAQLEQWLMHAKGYSKKQLLSVLHVASHVSKRTRQRLITQLEEGAGGLEMAN